MRGGDAGHPVHVSGPGRYTARPRPHDGFTERRSAARNGADGPDDADGLVDEDPVPARTARYREILRIREFRHLIAAYGLSMLGDQLAKVALSILVYNRTSSALLTATTLAISYLPWIAGGPALSALADRLERRRVLIVCDLARAVMIGVIAIPGISIPVLLLVLFLASMFSPPFESARSALTPQMLKGDGYVLGTSLFALTGQVCTMAGFLAGGLFTAFFTARGVILIDAGTFLASALLIVLAVRVRPVVADRGVRENWWRQITAGARYVFGDRRLSTMLLIVWTSAAFGFCWEGIAPPLVAELRGPQWQVGLLLGCSATGIVLGAVGIARLCPPPLRARLMLPGALLQQLALGIIAVTQNIVAVSVVVAISGLASSFLLPLNATFMRSIPDHLRGRAFGIAQGGLQAVQGLSLFLAGAVAGALAPTTTSGLFGIVGAVLLLPLILSRRFVPAA